MTSSCKYTTHTKRIQAAILGDVPGAASWVPLFMVTPNLQYLTLYQVGWTGDGSYAGSPMYLPTEPPPFRLKQLEIYSSHIRELPLRWLISGGSSTILEHLEVLIPQAEWDTFNLISKLRTEGLLSKVTCLSYTSRSSNGGAKKHFAKNTTAPLALWSGIKHIYMDGGDIPTRAAILHGISQLTPPPLIEMPVKSMRLEEFKGLFRLRKNKLQPGTKVRLLVKRPSTSHRDDRGRGWDYDIESYWQSEDVQEMAFELAEKHGIDLELVQKSLWY
ncbi:hypothetical protein BT63DRAFT_60230 [Microthyrium microscopicum]|uniref:Uncharacterized protein n=1 Tax=Microthyrium microscopicum TaxID=703497 RepID=A0A6A6U2V0_9PEZI|nr:hypothetical protein BT63DRAFT_60230 [Microthyrium microscopicum]